MSPSGPLAGLLRALDSRAAAPTERVLVGIEHEYSVWTGDRWLDARDVFDRSPPNGVRLHPDEPRRFLLPSGITLHADDHVAEVATPPVPVEPGFARMNQAWAELGRAELTAALPGDVEIRGESTHVSVAIAPGVSEKVALLYAQTFAPSLMLLLDLPTSPGLLIRPRPGRIEFCGEFVEGAALRTAVAFVVRTVRACSIALESGNFDVLPPALRVTLEPARVRFGWYVDRSAFGPDLYTECRSARLITLDGIEISAGEHMERAIACCASVPELPEDELDPLAQIATGSRPLPSEGTVAMETAGVHANGSVYAGLAPPRQRHDLTYEVVAGTWDFTAFRVRRNGHAAILNIPANRLDRFIDALDTGALDAHMGVIVDTAGSEPILISWTQTAEPGIFSDIQPGKALLPTDFMGVGNGTLQPLMSGSQLLATTVTSSALRMATGSQIAIAEGGASPLKGTGPFIGTTGWPWWYWACGVVVAALVGIGLVTVTGGDDTVVDIQPSAQPTPSAEPTPTPSGPGTPQDLDTFIDAMEMKQDASGDYIWSVDNVEPQSPSSDTDILSYGSGVMTLDQATADALFNDSVFGCDDSSRRMQIVCAHDNAEIEPGKMIVTAMTFADNAAKDAGKGKQKWQYIYASVFESNGAPADDYDAGPVFNWDFFQGTDRWFSLGLSGKRPLLVVKDPVGNEPASAARAVIQGRTIVFFIPARELPDPSGFRMTAFRHDGTFVPTFSSGDVSGKNPTQPLTRIGPRIRLGAAPPPPDVTIPISAIDTFIRAFNEAQSAGDVEFLMDALHPAVVDRYGSDQCRSTLAEAGAVELTMRGITGPTSFSYETDGVSTSIPSAYTVIVTATTSSGDSGTETHFVVRGTKVLWFTDCGDPI